MDNELLDNEHLLCIVVGNVGTLDKSTFTKKSTCPNNASHPLTDMEQCVASSMDHNIAPPLAALQAPPDSMSAPVSVPQGIMPSPSILAHSAAIPAPISTPTQPVASSASSLPPPSESLLPTTSSTQFFQPPLPTHADRNALNFVQPSRKLAKLSDAQKASLKIRRDADEAEQKAMNAELTVLLTKHRLELTELAGRHGKKVEYIDKLIGTSKHYKTKRGVNIENAKLHAKATEINSGKLSCLYFFFLISRSFPIDRSVGDRVKLPELRQMVKEDTAMQDLSEEQENELREEVIAMREQKKLGARPTNHSASQDYRHQLESLNDQVRFY